MLLFSTDYTIALLFVLASLMFACDLWMVYSTARLIGGVPKFGHIGEFMRETLHWLPVCQRILYRVSTIAWHCILGVAPVYLSEPFVLSSSCPGRRSLRSASPGDYLIPRFYTAIKQNRALSAAGPSIWNDLSFELRVTFIIALTLTYFSLLYVSIVA